MFRLDPNTVLAWSDLGARVGSAIAKIADKSKEIGAAIGTVAGAGAGLVILVIEVMQGLFEDRCDD